jgi:hypothetical protein
MPDTIDPGLKQTVLALLGPAFHVSQQYTKDHDGVDIAAAPAQSSMPSRRARCPTPGTRSTTPIETVVVAARIEDVERFAAPRIFRGRPGSMLRGFDPARPNQVVRQQDAASRTGDPAAAIVRISWPDMDPQPVPHGTFLEVASGFYKGLFVVAVEVDPDPA